MRISDWSSDVCSSDLRIVLVDLESTPVHDSAATLKDEGFEVAARAVDISDESQAKALMAFTRDLFGRLDILDNNAAYHGDVNDGDVLSMTVELWDKIMSRSEEHTSELQSLMRISYAVFCLKKKKKTSYTTQLLIYTK